MCCSYVFLTFSEVFYALCEAKPYHLRVSYEWGVLPNAVCMALFSIRLYLIPHYSPVSDVLTPCRVQSTVIVLVVLCAAHFILFLVRSSRHLRLLMLVYPGQCSETKLWCRGPSRCCKKRSEHSSPQTWSCRTSSAW